MPCTPPSAADSSIALWLLPPPFRLADSPLGNLVVLSGTTFVLTAIPTDGSTGGLVFTTAVNVAAGLSQVAKLLGSVASLSFSGPIIFTSGAPAFRLQAPVTTPFSLGPLKDLAFTADTIHVYTDTSMPSDYWRSVPGSSSHSMEPEFGIIMVSVDSAIALAQAIVHEMAHHKLRALGVSLLQAQRLITNDPADLFRSPIITTRKRPMTAVLHAQYSFIYVTALDVAIHDAADMPDEQKRHAAFLLARNVPRMEAGYEEIDAHVQTDADGAIFIASFMDWSRRVLARGREILDANGYGMPTL